MNTSVANHQVKRIFGRDYYFLPDSYSSCRVFMSGPSFRKNDEDVWKCQVDVWVDFTVRHPHMEEGKKSFKFYVTSVDINVRKGRKGSVRPPALSAKMILKVEAVLIPLNNFILQEYANGGLSKPGIIDHFHKIMKKPPK